MYIVLPTLLGVEALVSAEIQRLGFSRTNIEVRDGQVFLKVADDWAAVSRSVAELNVNIACGERVEVEILRAEVTTFDQLFETVTNYPWENIIVPGSAFTVAGGYSRKSKLFGIPACQSIIKKAVISRVLRANNLPKETILKEDPQIQDLRLQFSFMEDEFSLRFDTTGDGLHKRGYRIKANMAPLKETLAASLLALTHFKPFGDELLWDPFCGSGTILIEAARQAAGMAPGMRRNFSGERLRFFAKADFDRARADAESKVDLTPPDTPFFYGTDIDPQAIRIARANAERAGVADFIKFAAADAQTQSISDLQEKFELPYVTAVTNPPYGERLLDAAAAHRLSEAIGRVFFTGTGLRPHTKLYLITADENTEQAIGFFADKQRKLYNGMIPCRYYQFFRKTSRPYAPPTSRAGRKYSDQFNKINKNNRGNK
ncbi:THUMP domain-containing class I SAM-dependent RNA methyltransferase [Mageeibacillus indolicus]|uniref:Ribosomal RNA large subunit methyltransferase K/L-like methyltransferase domain-containing protein n=2 Tax=Mageeibacillus indolicus TaxID=884684 RepID=D3R1H0_MAGIU|nr:class I SAM-dependent RNA methyltransferase [Mageeibacillus indolicus]ADC91641.1 hypothetical protein HMPREF0868_0707 [Mageeibacillus indolicus UPII9-5]PNH19524.1 RNA methyltransferase [Mageeibacillus indolicus]